MCWLCWDPQPLHSQQHAHIISSVSTTQHTQHWHSQHTLWKNMQKCNKQQKKCARKSTFAHDALALDFFFKAKSQNNFWLLKIFCTGCNRIALDWQNEMTYARATPVSSENSSATRRHEPAAVPQYLTQCTWFWCVLVLCSRSRYWSSSSGVLHTQQTQKAWYRIRVSPQIEGCRLSSFVLLDCWVNQILHGNV